MSTTLSIFRYRARTLTGGEIKEGVIRGLTIDDAKRQLIRNRLIPEWVKEAEQQKSKTRGSYKAKTKSVCLFARQFATLIDAGIPLIQALDLAADLSDDKGLKRALEAVSADVQSGMTLAQAMRLHRKVFPTIFVNMVEAGEQGGILDTILNRLAIFLEKNQALQEKMRSAMIYPSIVLAVAFLSAGVMLIFVVPTFEQMFSESGMILPYPTQVLINLSEFLQAHWWKVGLGVFGVITAIKQFYQTTSGHEIIDGILLKVPVMGDLILKTGIARFSQSMASLLSAGVNLIDALVAGAGTAGNVVLQNAILSSRQAIEAGQGISGPLEETGIMPRLVPKMVRVGEQTGNLDEMFEKVSVFFEGEVEVAADRLMKAMEPAMISVVGVILGGMVIALYLPIFESLSTIN